MGHLPEDGHNKWPKGVEGYAVYNIINLHICIGICSLFLIRSHHCMVVNRLKLFRDLERKLRETNILSGRKMLRTYL